MINKEVYEGITGKRAGYISEIFFVVGLLAAIGLRIVLILNEVNSLYASIAWYGATILYIFFFIFRIYIEEQRRMHIVKNNLRDKVISKKLRGEDYHHLKIIIDSILISKVRWNFIILFFVSIITLFIQIILDIY